MTDTDNSNAIPIPQLEFTTLTADHLPEVLKIERLSFKDPWPESAFRDLMIQNRTNWVALRDGQIAGYLVTLWVLDEIHILNIAVAERFRRRGVGASILEFLIDAGRKKQMVDVYLEVRTSNTAAQKLYERFGFYTLSTRKRYYPDGEDALVLHKRIPARKPIAES